LRIDPRHIKQAIIHDQIAKFRGELRVDPNNALARYGLGIAYYNLGLVQEALDALLEAAKLMPENPYIQTQLGVLYLRLRWAGDLAAERHAWDRLERAERLRQNLDETILLRAELELQRGNREGSLHCWKQVSAMHTAEVQRGLSRLIESLSKDVMMLSSSLTRGGFQNSPLYRSFRAMLVGWLAIGCLAFFFLVPFSDSPVVAFVFMAILVIVPFGAFLFWKTRWRNLVSANAMLSRAQTALSNPSSESTDLFQIADGLLDEQRRLNAIGASSRLAPPVAQSHASQWEYCEIVARNKGTLGGGLAFQAEVTGPQGRHVLIESGNFIVHAGFPPKDSATNRKRVDALARTVLSDGWEQLPKGPDWYNYRFRRRIRP
jgi:tetratricopeptide (TPR) repeat protein